MNDGLVQNKRVCRDLLEFLDTKKPRGIDLREWDVMVENKVDVFSVPGMRTLDVDGLDDPEQAKNIEDLTAILGFMTIVMLSFGIYVGSQYFHTLRQELVFRQMIEEGIIQ